MYVRRFPGVRVWRPGVVGDGTLCGRRSVRPRRGKGGIVPCVSCGAILVGGPYWFASRCMPTGLVGSRVVCSPCRTKVVLLVVS